MAAALILAAGRGERMRPLTDTIPKPLLEVGGKSLIAWQVERLVAGGFDDLVVNHSHLGEKIERALGDGARFGARIRYSHEPAALETAGGVAQALQLLGDAPFAIVSGDVFTTFDYRRLQRAIDDIGRDPGRTVAHFVMVPNPPWHAAGDDMGLEGDRVVRGRERLTYASFGVFHPAPYRELTPGARLKMFPWAYAFVDAGRVSGERFDGLWDNIGTPAQLAALEARLAR